MSATAENSDKLVQLYGDVWEWTQSSYCAYPGYSPAKANASKPISEVWDDAVGEYNSRSMVNQYVLRGGSYNSAKHSPVFVICNMLAVFRRAASRLMPICAAWRQA